MICKALPKFTKIFIVSRTFGAILYFSKTVLLECTCVNVDDCFIRVYRLFTENFHKCIDIAINVFYIFPVILALCIMLSFTHHAQNYASIISGSLIICISMHFECSIRMFNSAQCIIYKIFYQRVSI